MNETAEPNEESVFPYNRCVSRAQQGDTGSVLLYCQAIEAMMDDFCKNRTFRGLFSKDEIRSIACLAALEFMMEYNGHLPDREVPYLLRRIIRCRLYDEARRLQTRLRYELTENGTLPAEEKEEDDNPFSQLAGPEDETPEALLLMADRKQQIQEYLKSLKPKQQELIRAMYCENKSTAEIAQEWHCSSRYVLMVKRDALKRLKELLRDTD